MIPIIISKEVLTKGRALPDGTIRDWKGKKVQKQGGKWVPYREPSSDLHSDNRKKSDTKNSRLTKDLTTLFDQAEKVLASIGIAANQNNTKEEDRLIESQWKTFTKILETITNMGGKVESFDWKEDEEAEEWLSKTSKSGIDILEINDGSDSIMYIAAPEQVSGLVANGIRNGFDYSVHFVK